VKIYIRQEPRGGKGRLRTLALTQLGKSLRYLVEKRITREGGGPHCVPRLTWHCLVVLLQGCNACIETSRGDTPGKSSKCDTPHLNLGKKTGKAKIGDRRLGGSLTRLSRIPQAQRHDKLLTTICIQVPGGRPKIHLLLKESKMVELKEGVLCLEL